MQQRLIAIGDSITLGHWDPSGGWAARLRAASDRTVLATRRAQYAAVYNLGISSNTSKDVLARYESEVEARLLRTSDEEAFVALAVGINDSRLSEGVAAVEATDYADNMHQLVTIASGGGGRRTTVIVVGITPVYEPLTDPVRWDKSKSFKNDRISSYNDIAKQVANDHGVAFASLFDDDVLNSQDVHPDWDGLHLNDRGHDRIAEIVGTTLHSVGWATQPPPV